MRSTRRCRRGVTLVETLIYASLLVIVLEAFSRMMFGLYAGSDRVNELLRSDAELRRIANQMTEDAHESTSAMIAPANQEKTRKLTLQVAPARRIEYESKTGRLIRLSFTDDTMESQESFHLPPGCEVNWKIEDNFLVVDIEPNANETSSVFSLNHIEARLRLVR